ADLVALPFLKTSFPLMYAVEWQREKTIWKPIATADQICYSILACIPWCFPAKSTAVRVKKTRQKKDWSRGSDSVRTEMAPAGRLYAAAQVFWIGGRCLGLANCHARPTERTTSLARCDH